MLLSRTHTFHAALLSQELNRFQKERASEMGRVLRDFALAQVRMLCRCACGMSVMLGCGQLFAEGEVPANVHALHASSCFLQQDCTTTCCLFHMCLAQAQAAAENAKAWAAMLGDMQTHQDQYMQSQGQGSLPAATQVMS